ncbi:trace amine-associated receptor 7f [Nematostella vectensis]|uniref:trace amine-associated receptor 7f n=1 Tax=Nematostella vectensis TaxID=45351 RepID=UPI002076EB6F|nr:trace amine-associated receptor 7f [Nematostella vectensis]
MAQGNVTHRCFFFEPSGDGLSIVGFGPMYITTIVTCVVNSLFAVTATLTNAVILGIIVKDETLHSPANLLIACLAASDLVIGSVTQPCYVAYKTGELLGVTRVSCVFRMIHWVFGWICTGVSMLTITAIAVERFLALHLHLRYPVIVTTSRILKVIATFWIACIAIISSLFALNSDRYWTFLPAPILLINIIVTIVAYWEIFRVLQRHRNQIRDQMALQVFSEDNASNASGVTCKESSSITSRGSAKGLNFKHYRKSAVTAVYVSLLLLLCYVPFFCAMITRVVVGYDTRVKVAYECAATLVYMNSTINPALYWRRIPDIRRAVRKFLRRFCCCRDLPVETDTLSHMGSRNVSFIRKESHISGTGLHGIT